MLAIALLLSLLYKCEGIKQRGEKSNELACPSRDTLLKVGTTVCLLLGLNLALEAMV